MHLRFEQMLQQLGMRLDTLIIDAPPILAVSDAAIIGRMAGATLMVARVQGITQSRSWNKPLND